MHERQRAPARRPGPGGQPERGTDRDPVADDQDRHPARNHGRPGHRDAIADRRPRLAAGPVDLDVAAAHPSDDVGPGRDGLLEGPSFEGAEIDLPPALVDVHGTSTAAATAFAVSSARARGLETITAAGSASSPESAIVRASAAAPARPASVSGMSVRPA